jgi:hypothetical protein
MDLGCSDFFGSGERELQANTDLWTLHFTVIQPRWTAVMSITASGDAVSELVRESADLLGESLDDSDRAHRTQFRHAD